jgi:hypothetical protein
MAEPGTPARAAPEESPEDRASRDLSDAVATAEADARRRRDERVAGGIDPAMAAAVGDAEHDVAAKRRKRNDAAAALEAAAAEHAAASADSATGLEPDDLGVRTERGRDTLEAWKRGELTAVELRRRWIALGELDAIERVRTTGRGDSPPPSTERVEAARKALDQAEKELSDAEETLERQRHDQQ